MQQGRAGDIGEMLEVVRLAVEERVVGGQRADHLAAFLAVIADQGQIALERAHPAGAHQRREARIDQHRLAFGQDNAGVFAHQFDDGAEIRLAIDAGADAGQPVGKGACKVCRFAHAASSPKPGATALDTSVSTLRISATRPSPQIVAPATPSTDR